MRKICFAALSLIGCSLLLVSCQKELSFETTSDNVSNPDLLGVWAFASLEAETIYDLSMTDGVDTTQTITTSHYFSKNNIGLLTIEPSKMTLSNYTYSIDTTMTAKFYENGIFVDEFELSFQFELPVANSVIGSYRLIGADSIYFPNGGILTMEAGSTTGIPTEPSGLRYKLEGDRLTITDRIVFNQTETDQDGIKTISKANGVQTIIFQKP